MSKEELKELPDKWYCEVTEDNQEVLNTWRRTKCDEKWMYKTVDTGYFILSKHIDDNSYFYGGRHIRTDEDFKDYKEISFKDFKRLVLKEEIMETNNTKEENKVIKISSDTLFSYFKAATDIQKEYLTKHFQLDGSTTVGSIKGLYELACPDWKPKIKANHPDCFKEDKVWKREIFPAEKKKFYLLERCSNNGFKVSSGDSRYTNAITTFQSKEEADNNALLYNTMMLMRSWAKFYNEVDEYKPTWRNDNHSKYGIRINYNELEACYKYNENVFIFQTSVSSQKRAEEMLTEFKDDLEKLIQLGMFN